MLSMSRRRHAFGGFAVLLLAAGCGGTPQQRETPAPEVVSSDNYYIGDNDVFAHLEPGPGGTWMFTTVTESEVQPSKGYLVRLNDLAPAFDTRTAECTPQAYPPTHRCNPLHPFRDKEVGVIDKLINGGIAAGTAGTVTELTRTYDTTFDEAAFNQAVDEALTNSGLDTERQAFFAALEEYAAILESSRSELQRLERETNERYRDTRAVRLDIDATVTGLTGYFTDDLDFRELIELVPQTARRANDIAIEKKKLLPCDASRCVQKARLAIASTRTHVDRARSGLLEHIESGTDVYDVRCDKTAHGGYLFTLGCPDELSRAGFEHVRVPLSLDIRARDFDGLYPRIDIADRRLGIGIDGDRVTFTNLTSSFLSVMAQTVYYNSQLKTSSASIDVAPGAAVTRPVSDFVSPEIEIESSYRQMTPDKAKGASFRFGFAAKYRIAGEVDETTLMDARTFNVGCAIENRLRPGSCVELPVENAQVRDFEESRPYVPN